MTKRDRHLHAGKLHGDPEVLDADIRPSDLVEVLRRLKFEEQFCVLWLDKPVCEFLITALTNSRRK